MNINNSIIINPLKITKYWKNQTPPKLSKFQKNSSKYSDPYFPPNDSSIFSKNPSGKFTDPFNGQENYNELIEDKSNKNLKWKRFPEVIKNPTLFNDILTFKEINQGNIGDCYFLSAISTLILYPYLIREKFRLNQINNYGYYEIIFFIDGEWQIVFLDDYFPYNIYKKEFQFAKPYKNELWVMLLEKAWAKINGGYSNIIGGNVDDPMNALTGFPTEEILCKDYNKFDLYNLLEKNYNEKNLISAASNKQNNIKVNGIEPEHSYSIIQVKKWKEKGYYLIRLRNPWGDDEFKGDWSDKSEKWNEENKKYFNYIDKNDGVFWISLEDFLKYYNEIMICNILYGGYFKNFYFESKSYFKDPCIFNLKLTKNSKLSLRIIFKHWRFNRELNKPIRPFSLILAKYNLEKNIKKIYSSWSSNKDVELIENLNEGYYVLFLYLQYDEVKEDTKNLNYTLQIFSDNNFQIEFLGLDKSNLFLQNLVLNYYSNNENLNLSEQYFYGSFNELKGINVLLIYNLTSDKFMEINLSVYLKNIKLLKPFDNMGQNFKLILPPQEKIAIFGIRLNNSSTSFNIPSKINLKSEVKDINQKFEKYKNNLEDFLKFDIDENSPESINLREKDYRFVTKEKIRSIPLFNQEKFIEISNEIIRRSSLSFVTNNNNNNNNNEILNKTADEVSIKENNKLPNNKIPIQNNNNNNINNESKEKNLINKYPNEFKILKSFFKKDNNPNVKKYFDKIDMDSGTYIGELDMISHKAIGRGIFIYKDNKKYIGHWYNNSMEGEGVLLDKDYKKIYLGNFSKGFFEGKGKFFIHENEYYEGNFIKNKIEGNGIYVLNNGDKWEGNFVNGHKNGIGILSLKNGEKYYCEYEKDNFISKYKYNKNNENNYNNFDIKKSVYIENNYNNKENEIIEDEEHLNDNNIKDLENKYGFIMNIIFSIDPPNFKENFKKINFYNNIEYIGSIINNNIKHGRGCYYDNNNYYIGLFINNESNGFFKIFDHNKLIIFKGFLANNFSIVNNVWSKKYLNNGYCYKGSFLNGIEDGNGILTYNNGECWSGPFKNGKFNGIGRYFSKYGKISQMIKYENIIFIKKDPKIKTDFIDSNSNKFFNELQNYNFPIQQLLNFPNNKKFYNNLIWIFKKINDITYIGQMDNETKILNGKGVFIYSDENLLNKICKYYVGFIENGEMNGKGKLFDINKNLIFDGKFKNNKKNGFGKLFLKEGNFIGYFKNDCFEGKGVYYNKEFNYKYEGYFSNNKKINNGFLISLKLQTIQELKYKQGNIIFQKEKISFNSGIFFEKMNNQFNFLKNNFDYFINLILKINPISENLILERKIIYENNKMYIGELNQIGFKHGRGVLLNLYTKEFYIGYFYNNEKFNFGIIYYDINNIKYKGNFKNNKPYGKGIYYYKNGDMLEGEFNEIGCGLGNYFIKEKNVYWKGNFYEFQKDGIGELYDAKTNTIIKQEKYELNNFIE